MERFDVRISERADSDIRAALLYISKELRNPQAALDLADALTDEIASLKYMPERYPLLPDSYLASLGYRKTSVNNRLIFYTVDAEHRIVNIARVLYSRRNWRDIVGRD